jgi:hypothetical protein
MVGIGKIILDGAILSLLASIFLIAILQFNPRLFLQDYPQTIQSKVPPKTKSEKRQSWIVGVPFLLLLFAVPFISTLSLKNQSGTPATFLQLFLNAFGVAFAFNLVDLVLLDWLVFCTITPKFVIIPGTEGDEGYKDYAFHFRASIVGTIISLVAGLLIAGLVSILL